MSFLKFVSKASRISKLISNVWIGNLVFREKFRMFYNDLWAGHRPAKQKAGTGATTLPCDIIFTGVCKANYNRTDRRLQNLPVRFHFVISNIDISFLHCRLISCRHDFRDKQLLIGIFHVHAEGIWSNNRVRLYIPLLINCCDVT